MRVIPLITNIFEMIIRLFLHYGPSRIRDSPASIRRETVNATMEYSESWMNVVMQIIGTLFDLNPLVRQLTQFELITLSSFLSFS